MGGAGKRVRMQDREYVIEEVGGGGLSHVALMTMVSCSLHVGYVSY